MVINFSRCTSEKQSCSFSKALQRENTFENFIKFLAFDELEKITLISKCYFIKVQSFQSKNIKKLLDASSKLNIFSTYINLPTFKVNHIIHEVLLDWHSTEPFCRKTVLEIIKAQNEMTTFCSYSLESSSRLPSNNTNNLRLSSSFIPSPYLFQLVKTLCSADESIKEFTNSKQLLRLISKSFDRVDQKSNLLLKRTVPLFWKKLCFSNLEDYLKTIRRSNIELAKIKFSKDLLEELLQLKINVASCLFGNSEISFLKLELYIYETLFEEDEKLIKNSEVIECAVKMHLNKPIYSQHLIKLNLSGSGILLIPKYIGMLSALQNLELGCNYLTYLPDEIKNLKELVSIDLSRNNFTVMPSVLLELKKLETLIFDENSIKNIPEKIYKCTSLKNLQLNACDLTDLPEEFELLDDLISLGISNNYFTELPDFIFFLPKLTIFAAAANLFESIPEGIVFAKQLEFIDFSQNNIKIIPKEIKQITKLVDFFISNNLIEYVPIEIIKLKDLSTLDLSYNYISEIDIKLKHVLKLRGCTVVTEGNPVNSDNY